jgi:hypothetical protein
LEGGVNIFLYADADPLLTIDPLGGAPHKKNARKSTKDKHQKGQASAKRSRGGEKADEEKRRVPRKRPAGYKGSWPPKSARLICIPTVVWDIVQGYCDANPSDPACYYSTPKNPDDPCKGDPYCI